MIRLLRLFPSLLLAALLGACGQKETGHAHGGGHAHTAPHGGLLLEVGEHAYNLELLRDPTTGRLTAWVLDGHAENFIRLPLAALEVVVAVGAEKKPLTLLAVTNRATGETKGDTSQFEAQADWLKSAGPLDVTVPVLEIRGSKFGPLTARLSPPGK